MSIEKVVNASGTVYRVRFRDGRGESAIQRSRTFPTMRQAREFQKQLGSRQHPSKAAASSMTTYMETYRARVWEEVEQQALRPTSANTLLYGLGLFVDLLPRGCRVQDVTPAVAKDVLMLLSQTRPKSTVQLVRSAARRCMASAVDAQVIASNPVPTRFAYPKHRHVETAQRGPKAPTEAQVLAMLEVTERPDLKTVIMLAASLGLRRGELCGLRWSDVELGDAPSISITHVITEWVDAAGKTQIELRDGPKSSASRRVIALSETEASILRLHRDYQVNLARAYHAIWNERMFLFPAQHQFYQPMRPSSLTAALGAIQRRVGIPKGISAVHGLRHRAANSLLARVPIEVLSARLGHSSPQVTWAAYIHPEQQHLEKAAQASDAAWAEHLAPILKPRVV